MLSNYAPDDPVVYRSEGVTLLDQGELRAAVQAFDRAIQLGLPMLNPTTSRSWRAST